MAANNHPSAKKNPTEAFYAQQNPVNAIELAIEDHRAYAGGVGQVEFVRQLRLAQDVMRELDTIKSAMQAALNVVQLNLKGVEGDWPEGTDTPDGPDFELIEQRVKAALVILHWR